MRHLASAQYWDRITNCPLNMVLTLMYLLNLQIHLLLHELYHIIMYNPLPDCIAENSYFEILTVE